MTVARDVLTTGQAATLLRVSARTVSKWIDCGLLAGYRIPGSLHRRVHRADVAAFFGSAGMPFDAEGRHGRTP